MNATKPTLSLVIPLYNEAANAQKVAKELIEELSKEYISYELVLVNNGSKDNTGHILSKLAKSNPEIKIVTVPVNQGYGWGVINGLRWASGDYLGFMGGDGQIEPGDVSKVFKGMVEGK